MKHTPQTSTDKMRAVCRATIEIMDKLDAARPDIEIALDHGIRTHSFDDLCEMVVQGKLRPIFLPENTLILASVSEYPRAKHWHIFMATGNLEVIMAHADQLIQAAKDEGCQRITINGRPGWAKALEHLGARRAYTTMALEVE